MTNKILEQVEQAYLKKDIPQFSVGDTVDVHTRIVEGDKERIQVFSGTVLMKKGRGMNETFTVRRIVNNEGVERIFPLHSPFISKVVVKRGATGAAGTEGGKKSEPVRAGKSGSEARELAGAAAS